MSWHEVMEEAAVTLTRRNMRLQWLGEENRVAERKHDGEEIMVVVRPWCHDNTARQGELQQWACAGMVRSRLASRSTSRAGTRVGHDVVEVEHKRAPSGLTEGDGVRLQQEPTMVARRGGARPARCGNRATWWAREG